MRGKFNLNMYVELVKENTNNSQGENLYECPGLTWRLILLKDVKDALTKVNVFSKFWTIGILTLWLLLAFKKLFTAVFSLKGILI